MEGGREGGVRTWGTVTYTPFLLRLISPSLQRVTNGLLRWVDRGCVRKGGKGLAGGGDWMEGGREGGVRTWGVYLQSVPSSPR
jgi:hypothetical protein